MTTTTCSICNTHPATHQVLTTHDQSPIGYTCPVHAPTGPTANKYTLLSLA